MLLPLCLQDAGAGASQDGWSGSALGEVRRPSGGALGLQGSPARRRSHGAGPAAAAGETGRRGCRRRAHDAHGECLRPLSLTFLLASNKARLGNATPGQTQVPDLLVVLGFRAENEQIPHSAGILQVVCSTQKYYFETIYHSCTKSRDFGF